MKDKLIFIIVLICLALGMYSHTLNNQFQFDDTPFIVENYSIRDISDIAAIWEGVLPQHSRFVAFFTFALNYHFHKLDVFGYRVTNLVIHIVTALLVSWLCSLLISSPKVEDEYLLKNKKAISYIAGLLFLCHPVQTQAIVYITQRFASLATMFYVFAVCLYLQARLSEKKGSKILFLGAFLIVTLLGMFTKEITITIPLMVVFLELLFINKYSSWAEISIGLKRNNGWIIILVLSLMLLIIPQQFTFSVYNQLFSPKVSNSHDGDIITFGKYVITQFRVVMTFLRLLFIPVNLNADYDFALSNSLFELKAMLSFLATLFVVALGWIFRRKWIFVSFGIMWIFITFSPNFIPRSDVIFEHKLYLISVGFCISLAVCFYRGVVDVRGRRVFLCFVLGVLAIMTYQRNLVWENHLTLWEDIVKKSPNKARAHNNLSAEYVRREKYNLAIKEANKAIQLNPGYYKSFYNRGIAYYSFKLFDSAIKDFKHSIALDPTFYDAHNYLGIYYFNNGKINEALSSYNEALKHNPNYVSAYNNRGMVYLNKRQYELALKDFNKAISLDSKHIKAYYNRGNVYYAQGKEEKAIEEYTRVLDLDANFVEVLNNRGRLYLDLGKYELALRDFNKAVSINPSYRNVYFNRAELFEAMGKKDLARKDYMKVEDVSADYIDSLYNKAIDLKEEGKYQQAIKEFDKVILIDGKKADAYNNRGNLYGRMGQYDLAMKDYNLAIKYDSSHAKAFNNRGTVYRVKGKLDLALKDFDRAIKIDSSYAFCYFNRSLVYKEKGDLKNALKEALKAQSLGFRIEQSYLDLLKS